MPLSNLNKEQHQAAVCNSGYNLIISSAGTGKTSTIVARIAHLLNSGINPNDILLLTFTNKASAQMLSRIAKYFSDEIASSIFSGTFHSVSFKLLKKLDIKIILKQPNELKTLFKSIYEKRVFNNIDQKISPYDGGYLYDLYSLYLNSNNCEDFSSWLTIKSKEHKDYYLIYEDVIEEFNELKTQYGYVSFDDLLLLMLEYQKTSNFKFSEVLVDEYQDTNPLQNRLIDSFNTKSLFCVGDYDQSIYGFNGSDIGIISSFEKRYKDSTIYTLKKNYRSTKPILQLASRVIKNNSRIYQKQLEVIREEIIQQPKLLAFNELFEQYEHISNLISKSKTNHNNIAIIFRNNSTADGIEVNLRQYNILVSRKGGHSFFDSLEIKAILDIMTLILNCNDMMAFINILQYGKGIGKSISKELFDAFIKVGEGNLFDGLFNPDYSIKNPYANISRNSIQLGLFDDFIELGSLSKFRNSNFHESFLSNGVIKHPKLSLDGGEFLYSFYILMKSLKKIKYPSSMIDHIVKSQLFIKIKDIISRKRATQKDGSLNDTLLISAKNKIDSKVTLLKNLSKNYKHLSKFINSMLLGGSEISQANGVNLLTIHASKGLEFDEVYIIDLMEGRFPNKKLIAKGGSIEEERRLFYVAVTRAKDILYLSYAKYDKIKKIDFLPSQFLKEAGLIKSDSINTDKKNKK